MGSNSNSRGGNEEFEAYFRRADLDGDGQISGAEAVAFFQGSNLPKQVLAQVWTYADQRKAGYLGRQEFFNALKLVTVAQSNRQLTPEMVQKALHGPASSMIPAPKINLAAIPSPNAASSSAQPAGTVLSAPQNTGVRPPQMLGNANINQQPFVMQQNQFMRPFQAAPSGPAPGPRQVIASQGVPRAVTGVASAPTPQNANISSDWLGGGNIQPTSQVLYRGMALPTSQVGSGLTQSGLTTAVQPIPRATAGQMLSTSHKPQDSAVAPSLPASMDSKVTAASGNGFSFDSHLGNAFSAAPVQSKDSSNSPASSAGSLPASSVVVPPSSESQPLAGPKAVDSLQRTLPQQPVSGLLAETQSRQPTAQGTSGLPSTGYPAGTGYSASNQSQHPWPKMTQSDIQKYMKVFVQVDTDRDGKITGEQARNLFLSWRLPREVLKQVWDLSDQDSDSMLSLKEFCVAVYLMERHREGHPLPATLPLTISSDETLLSVTSPSNASFGSGSFRPSSGLQQPQVMTGIRPTHAAAAARPPRPRAIPHADERPPVPQKPKIPVLEKHLVDQLSEEEQNSLNSKFQEASQADKKVEDLEKEISESRQKIEFFRAKMQELILYKSRCDNRLNEVSARVSSDKREVEVLAKKYEEKCKQAGDVASRLTIEEATFRDIQEKKMELYRAIVKMEEGDTADGVLKERVEHIQSSLEELVRTLNERCKQYGLRAKPTSLVELPFGWQPGIQEGAADWDEDWDKFQDEEYTFVKELTLDVHNVVAPPKAKSSLVRQEASSTVESSPKAELKSEKALSAEKQVSSEEAVEKNENGVASSPGESPNGNRASESQSNDFRESLFTEPTAGSGSPREKEIERDVAGAKSESSGGKGISEPRWGTFDSYYDSESVWGLDSISGKDMDHGSHNEFDIGEFGLNPIKTGSSLAFNTSTAKSPFTFTDSVPSTPVYDQGKSIFADSVPSTPAYNQGKSPFTFADSVPSTPAYNQGKSPFAFADSVPSTPAYKQGKSVFTFADSVPSTPAYNNSPKRLSGGSDDYSFDSFSRFDSFNMHDTGLFQSSGPSFSRFDSMRSTAESDQNYALPSRFDSFREPVDSDQNHGFSRFDTFKDSNQSHGFSKFDSFRDSDINGAFRSSFDSFGESKDFDLGHGFSRFDSFSTHDSGQFQSSDKSFARFDSSRGSRDFDNSHGFSFDDTDPFGSDGPFKSSIEHETPRKTSDNWGF